MKTAIYAYDSGAGKNVPVKEVQVEVNVYFKF